MKRLTVAVKYFSAALLPLVILMFLPLRPAIIGRFGEGVVLRASPADPADVFRGEYVALTFDIATLEPEVFGGDVQEAVRGSTWHVALSPDGSGVWQASRAFREVPSGAYITGNVKKSSQSAVTMDYGTAMSRIYVAEGMGRTLESSGTILVKVSLLHGSAVILSAEGTE